MLHPSVDARDSSGEMICAKPGVPQFSCPLRESGLFTPQPAAHDLKNHVSTITRMRTRVFCVKKATIFASVIPYASTIAKHLTPILNVSDITASFVWFDK